MTLLFHWEKRNNQDRTSSLFCHQIMSAPANSVFPPFHSKLLLLCSEVKSSISSMDPIFFCVTQSVLFQAFVICPTWMPPFLLDLRINIQASCNDSPEKLEPSLEPLILFQILPHFFTLFTALFPRKIVYLCCVPFISLLSSWTHSSEGFVPIMPLKLHLVLSPVISEWTDPMAGSLSSPWLFRNNWNSL